MCQLRSGVIVVSRSSSAIGPGAFGGVMRTPPTATRPCTVARDTSSDPSTNGIKNSGTSTYASPPLSSSSTAISVSRSRLRHDRLPRIGVKLQPRVPRTHAICADQHIRIERRNIRRHRTREITACLRDRASHPSLLPVCATALLRTPMRAIDGEGRGRTDRRDRVPSPQRRVGGGARWARCRIELTPRSTCGPPECRRPASSVSSRAVMSMVTPVVVAPSMVQGICP